MLNSREEVEPVANETILISEVIPATPERIFGAWLDSAEHSAFTGSQASVIPAVGGVHTAWDGYVQGRTLELHDGARIVQSWRTTEFPPDSPDSRIEVTLEPTLGGTLFTLLHTDIPSGQSDRYRERWNEYYLSRMKTYFAQVAEGADEADDLDADAQDQIEDQTIEIPGASSRSVPPRPVATKAVKKVVNAAASRTPAKRAIVKSAIKATGRAAEKATKKAARRPVRKAAGKAVGKVAKRVGRLIGKKVGRQVGKKVVKKAARRAAKKVVKKVARTAAKKSGKQSGKTSAKRATKRPKTRAKKAAQRSKR